MSNKSILVYDMNGDIFPYLETAITPFDFYISKTNDIYDFICALNRKSYGKYIVVDTKNEVNHSDYAEISSVSSKEDVMVICDKNNYLFDFNKFAIIETPFSTKDIVELLTSVKNEHTSNVNYEYNGVIIDPEKRFIYNETCKEKLTHKEYSILEVLFNNIDNPIYASVLLEKVWNGDNSYLARRSLDVYACKLNKSILNKFGLRISLEKYKFKICIV